MNIHDVQAMLPGNMGCRALRQEGKSILLGDWGMIPDVTIEAHYYVLQTHEDQKVYPVDLADEQDALDQIADDMEEVVGDASAFHVICFTDVRFDEEFDLSLQLWVDDAYQAWPRRVITLGDRGESPPYYSWRSPGLLPYGGRIPELVEAIHETDMHRDLLRSMLWEAMERREPTSHLRNHICEILGHPLYPHEDDCYCALWK